MTTAWLECPTEGEEALGQAARAMRVERSEHVAELRSLRAEVARLRTRLEQTEARGGSVRVVAFGFGEASRAVLARAEAAASRLEEIELVFASLNARGLELLARLEAAVARAERTPDRMRPLGWSATGRAVERERAVERPPDGAGERRSVSAERSAALRALVEENLALRQMNCSPNGSPRGSPRGCSRGRS